jgi:hypothetical protein
VATAYPAVATVKKIVKVLILVAVTVVGIIAFPPLS